MTEIAEIALDFCRVQNVAIKQIVKRIGIEMRDGLPVLRIEVLEESRPTLRRLVAYPSGQPLGEDPGCYLGTMTINDRERHIYLAD